MSAETFEAVAFGLFFLGFFSGAMLMNCIMRWDRNSGSETRDLEPWVKK